MLFSSPIFLFLFLPVVLLLYFIAPKRFRNSVLTGASLLFYAWGEPVMVLLMLGSIFANYLFGLWVERVQDTRAATPVLTLSVIFNLGMLVYYKYAMFLVEAFNQILQSVGLPALEWSHKIVMPIGISFYTFQAMSYVIDVYRKEVPAQRNMWAVALYITLFPQLIAGPIVRYIDVAAQLAQRTVTSALFAKGIQRFVFGLGKKMLIANTMALVADSAFDSSLGQLSPFAAWIGLICYAFQIYFDFSGYSDMAIGLGLMFGFEFLENFNYPYISRSITEFWRRWHMSLSTWFRDYLYIPLGGNRRGAARTYVNLLIVFFLCGLWHGASWNFVCWGLFHGSFLVFERIGLTNLLARCWRPVQHAYTLLAVLVGWVFFRAETFADATAYLKTMFGLASKVSEHAPLEVYIDRGLWVALIAAVLVSMPIGPWLQQLASRWMSGSLIDGQFAPRQGRAFLDGLIVSAFGLARVGFVLTVLVASASMMLAGTHNPFIYFRF